MQTHSKDQNSVNIEVYIEVTRCLKGFWN